MKAMRKIAFAVLAFCMVTLSVAAKANHPAKVVANYIVTQKASTSSLIKSDAPTYIISISISSNGGNNYTGTAHIVGFFNGNYYATTAPTAITINININSSEYVGSLSAILPAGQSSGSETFTSTYTPSITITSVSPTSYNSDPITFTN